MRSNRIDANRAAVLELLARLHDPDIEIAELQYKLALDLALSFRLLRHVNSTFLSLHRQVRSIGQAVTLLGLEHLKQWASLTALTSTDDTPAQPAIMGLVRARFCELAAHSNLDADTAEMFTLGLFSVIDSAFDSPMEELLGELPLAPDICDALVKHSGRAGDMLDCLDALEHGEGSRAEWILPNAGELYSSAQAWANDATKPLFAH